jgi:undecaprenyl-diphosphatase
MSSEINSNNRTDAQPIPTPLNGNAGLSQVCGTRLADFLSRRFSRENHFGLHLTLGLALCVVAIGFFGAIADDLDEGGAFTRFDSMLAARLHEHAQENPATVAMFRPVTALGSERVLVAFAIGVALVLSLRGHRPMSRAWLLVFCGGFLHQALKAIFQRGRPVFEDPFIVEASWSFPSGHAMASLIGYGLFAYLLWLAVPRGWTRVAIIASIALMVLAIGFSRLYLGAHYFSDVLAGYAAGGAWLSLSIAAIEVVRRSRRGRA